MSNTRYKIGAVSKTSLCLNEINELTGTAFKDDGTFYIDGVTTIDHPIKNRMLFIEGAVHKDFDLRKLDLQSNLIIADGHISMSSDKIIFAKNPRMIFSKIVSRLFDYFHGYWDDYYSYSELAENFPKVRTMGGVTVHKTSVIGAGSLIYPGVVIGPNCKIGLNSIIKPNAVIGYPGFGIYKDDFGKNTHLPHVGGVYIGDHVEIGALNTVCSGTIHPTVIEDEVKTDDHVHIAHNCFIAKGVQIAAHAELSGSVSVEKNSWISPNVSVVNGITIGDSSFIGIGACVLKEVPKNTTVVGNPARPLKR